MRQLRPEAVLTEADAAVPVAIALANDDAGMAAARPVTIAVTAAPFMGLGGGSIMIPFMVLVMSMSQQHAHGTSLAVMLPLVTLPAVLKYYSKGFVNIPVAAWMAAGVFLGGYFGALIATSLPEDRQTCSMLAAIAAGSATGPSRPMPGSTRSTIAPPATPTTGSPDAWASITDTPKVSFGIAET